MRGQAVYIDGFGDRRWSIDDMLDDINQLREYGRGALNPWWYRYGSDPTARDADPRQVASLLDEYWRRTQIVLRELVDHSFPDLAESLNFYQAMPVRYRVRVKFVPNYGQGMAHVWSPVATWEKAGADVEQERGDVALYDDKTYPRVMAELARLGRTGCTSLSYVQGALPRFDGSHRNRRFDGETAVLRNALELLVADLDRLLTRLPGGSSLKSKCVVGA